NSIKQSFFHSKTTNHAPPTNQSSLRRHQRLVAHPVRCHQAHTTQGCRRSYFVRRVHALRHKAGMGEKQGSIYRVDPCSALCQRSGHRSCNSVEEMGSLQVHRTLDGTKPHYDERFHLAS
ncbi:hypothetical protein LINPERPRIM_LOCUS29909, partial [Linum perenne]